MKNGYDQFFKSAKGGNGKKQKGQTAKQRAAAEKEAASAEEFLRQALNMAPSNTRPPSRSESRNGKAAFPLAPVMFLLCGIAGGIYGYMNPDKFTHAISQVEVRLFGSALAENSTGNSSEMTANSSSTGTGGKEKSAASTTVEAGEKCGDGKGFSEEELSHFNKLNERKKELDLREAELTALEEELHKQRSEIEARITKLEQVREEVANVLKERVEVDEQRVATLVDFYSNMKPKQAAEILGKINENLAVEILGKMKKKNAAEILNLIDPTKARVLSEKFTGYTRR